MKKYKFLFLFAFLIAFGVIMAISASAYYEQYDGVWYDLNNSTGEAYPHFVNQPGQTGYTFDQEEAIIPATFVAKNGQTFTVTKIGDNAFQNCSMLKKVVIPNTVKIIGSAAFYNCTNLATIEFDEDDGKSQLELICGGAFGKTAISTFTIFENVNIGNFNSTGGSGSAEGIFRDCKNLTEVIFENSCPKITTIPQNFINGTSVEKIVLPRNTTRIEGTSLKSSVELTITIPVSSIVYVKNDAFVNSPTILYPGTTEDYQNYIVSRVDHGDYQNYFQQAYNNRNNGKFVFVECVPEYDIHKSGDRQTMAYPNGFDKEGYVSNVCAICSNDIIEKVLAPIFTAKGYSISDDRNAIIGGYEINFESLDAYEDFYHITLEYGIIFVNVKTAGDSAEIEFVDGIINIESGLKAIQVKVTMNKDEETDEEKVRFDKFNFKVKGFGKNETNKDVSLVIAMYILDENSLSFIQRGDSTVYDGNELTEKSSGQTLKGLTLNTMSNAPNAN